MSAAIPIVVMFGGRAAVLRQTLWFFASKAAPTRSRLVGAALLALRHENRVPFTR